MSNYRLIDPVDPSREIIAEAIEVMRAGGIVIFPTRCLYGLGADAFNVDAVERIYTLKRRASVKPILVLVSDRGVVVELVQTIPPVAQKIMDRFWPGKVTIILKATSTLPVKLTASTGKIGIRLTGQPVARAIASAFGGPITGTSANWAGYGGVASIAELPPEMLKSVDLILDGGKLKGGVGSTVVDVTQIPPKVLREGEIQAQRIIAMSNRIRPQ